MEIETTNKTLKSLEDSPNRESFWRRTKGLGQHDTVKLNVGSGAVSGEINILGLVGNSPDIIPITPDPADDEFEGTVLDTTGARWSGGATPWAWINQGGSSYQFNRGAIVLNSDPSDSDDVMRGIFQAAPTAPWVFRAKINRAVQDQDDFQWLGMFVYNSGNTKYHFVGVRRHSGTGVSFANSDSWGLDPYFQMDISRNWYVEIENDGTTLYYRFSATGHDGTFYLLNSKTIASTIGAVTHIGLGFRMTSTANDKIQGLVVEWFRRIS